MYRISFVLNTAIGSIFTIILGLIISYVSGFNKIEDVNPLYLAPFLRPKSVVGKSLDIDSKEKYNEVTNIIFFSTASKYFQLSSQYIPDFIKLNKCM